MEQTNNPSQPLTNDVSEAKKTSLPLIVGGLILLVIVGAGAYVLGQRTNTMTATSDNTDSQNEGTQVTPSQDNTSESGSDSVATDSNANKWTRTSDMWNYSFEYPTGWHVAFLWPESQNEGIRIAIDIKPINTAPRGGSLDDLNVIEYSGIPNPEERLQSEINDFKKNLTNAQESTISAQIGEVKFIKGNMMMMGQMEAVEAYFFMIPAQTANDKINYRVMTATIGSNSERAPILNHIIRSFQKVTVQ